MKPIPVFFSFEGSVKQNPFRTFMEPQNLPLLNDYVELEDGSTYRVWLRKWHRGFTAISITLIP